MVSTAVYDKYTKTAPKKKTPIFSPNNACKLLNVSISGEIKPIGFMRSLFCHKRGTPRQPSICPQARGTLTLDRLVVNNPQYTLEGLQEFSHVW